MKIDIELVPGTPGAISLIDTTRVINQLTWFYDPDAETEASIELASELRQIGAKTPTRAITCKVERSDGEKLIPVRVARQVAIKLARAQGLTVGHLEEKVWAMEGEWPPRYLVGEVKRGSTSYEVFFTHSGRDWEAFEAEIDGPATYSSGRALGGAARMPDVAGLAREHVMAHGSRERRRISPPPQRKRRAVSHV